ncbi:MAG: hypothetical protein JXQ71_04905 [Verrucomicrobia bacterium]|nr:hypothetical protein [Verrucomicrobiota bacterium]
MAGLQAVDSRVSYAITDLDAGSTAKRSGQEPLDPGLTAAIRDKPGAAILIYQQAE